MSMYEWRIFCETEHSYISTYSLDAPTTCPNHPDHIVADGSAFRQDLQIPGQTTVIDSTPNAAYFQTTSLVIDVPEAVEPQTITKSMTFPFDMYIWEMQVSQTEEQKGDILNVVISPNTVIGLVTEATTVGSRSVKCTNTVFPHVTRGCELYIATPDFSIQNSTCMVTNLSYTNSTITFMKPLTTSFPAGSYIVFGLYPIRNLIMDGSTGRLSIGNKGLKARLILANTPVDFIYQDNTVGNAASKVTIHLQYYFI